MFLIFKRGRAEDQMLSTEPRLSHGGSVRLCTGWSELSRQSWDEQAWAGLAERPDPTSVARILLKEPSAALRKME